MCVYVCVGGGVCGGVLSACAYVYVCVYVHVDMCMRARTCGRSPLSIPVPVCVRACTRLLVFTCMCMDSYP